MFVKLFASILESSIWSEDPSTRLVWITMLAMADPKGCVLASVPGLARRANVSLEDCDAALEKLASPDQRSRTKDHEGRRVEEVEGGWLLLNYEQYREIRTEEQLKSAARSLRYYYKTKAEKEHQTSRTSRTEEETTETTETTEKPTTTTKEVSSLDNRNLPVLVGDTHTDRKEWITRVGHFLEDTGHQTARRIKVGEMRAFLANLTFAYWQAKTDHTRAKLDKDRLSRLVRHLKNNNDDINLLLYAIDGWFKDPTFKKMADEGRKLDGIENIFTTQERIERLAGHCKKYRDGKPHSMATKTHVGFTAP